jgi:hypothetical protein
MTNKTDHAVMVALADGTLIFVRPQGTLKNEDVVNLSQVRKFFKVTEDLGEPVMKKGKGILNG